MFNSDTDTEVLLNLYLHYKSTSFNDLHRDSIAPLFQRLNGIFSLAIWDVELNALLLARDSLGVKPLYYYSAENSFHFSSEIKSLLPNLPHKLNIDALNKYLTFLWCPGSDTPLHDVSKLGPGELLWVSTGSIVKHQQWFSLPIFNRSDSKINRHYSSTAVSSVSTVLRDAVHRQMVSDVPLGAFLSGGLDSSSIVAFAAQINPELQTFTIKVDSSFDEGFVDDLPYARRVASHLGVHLDVVEVDFKNLPLSIEHMVWQLDEPLADLAPLNTYFISDLARQQGIKVLLSGTGGDDLFSGYRRHLALRFEPFWKWLPRNSRTCLRHLSDLFSNNTALSRRLRKFSPVLILKVMLA